MHASILKYFAAVARSGSIRKASEELHVATSALSRQIKKLEDELGITLFERFSNGLRLTAAGEEVLRHAKGTLREFEILRSDLGAMQGKKTGRVRVACLDSLTVKFLPEQVSAFHAQHPAVSFYIQTAGHGNITNYVAKGDVDLGLTFDLARPDDTEMVFRVPMPLVACVGKNHPLAKHKTVSLLQCSQFNLLLQLDTQPIRSLIEIELSVFERTGRSFVISNSQMMLKPFIMSGQGVAFFTPLGFMDEIKSGDIVPLPISGSRLQNLHIGILVQKRRQLTHAAEAVIEAFSRGLQKYSDTIIEVIQT
ncbi:LysR family transcriptional regulator [Rhizobium sp. LC145]|uniref:LysR family transcriptional regulator n=1 Tax=Rhizobium sp. LC145 TaxID=1120688 RepID=UPI000629E632|nr:LysR family transcriptional regulator [Rhizobium sp. LC145]KKX32925.1 LysR family transcriptional regulator [Rhizobium sp. LC145]TKT57339.1 LysR family transcriptional regulator [Rhizobiaceae bacterium LC148]